MKKCEIEQEAQLLQRDCTMLHVIDNFAKSLKVSQDHSKWHCRVGRVQVPISIPLKLCLYLVPFAGYFASKNASTLKPGVGVVQGHWKWRCSIDYIRLYWSAIVSIARAILYHFWVMWHWIIMAVKSGSEVTEGHSNWYHLIAWVRLPSCLP